MVLFAVLPESSRSRMWSPEQQRQEQQPLRPPGQRRRKLWPAAACCSWPMLGCPGVPALRPAGLDEEHWKTSSKRGRQIYFAVM